MISEEGIKIKENKIKTKWAYTNLEDLWFFYAYISIYPLVYPIYMRFNWKFHASEWKFCFNSSFIYFLNKIQLLSFFLFFWKKIYEKTR